MEMKKYTLLFALAFCFSITETGKHQDNFFRNNQKAQLAQLRKQVQHEFRQSPLTLKKYVSVEDVLEFYSNYCRSKISTFNTQYGLLITALILSILAYNHFGQELLTNSSYDPEIIQNYHVIESLQAGDLEEIRTLFGDEVTCYLIEVCEGLMIHCELNRGMSS